MIKQVELRAFVNARRVLEDLEKTPDVQRYLAARDDVKERLDSLRARAKAGESVQAGTLRLTVKHTLAVSWETLVRRLRELPAIARAITRDPAAQLLLDQAATRDEEADFVTTRLVVDVVAA